MYLHVCIDCPRFWTEHWVLHNYCWIVRDWTLMTCEASQAERPPEGRYKPKCQECRGSNQFRSPGPLGQDPKGSGKKSATWHPPNSLPVTSTAGNILEGPRHNRAKNKLNIGPPASSAWRHIPMMTWNREHNLYWCQTRILQNPSSRDQVWSRLTRNQGQHQSEKPRTVASLYVAALAARWACLVPPQKARTGGDHEKGRRCRTMPG